MNQSAATSLGTCIGLQWKWHKRQNDGTVVLYCKAINLVLQTCTKDDVIAENDTALMSFTQRSGNSPTEYHESHEIRPDEVTVCKKRIYLNAIFIDVLPEFMHQGMQSHLGINGNATVHDLMAHATLLLKFQIGSLNTVSHPSTNKTGKGRGKLKLGLYREWFH